jgi:hypothetical protein
MSIKCYKLVTGEEVIAKEEETGPADDFVILKDPVALVPVPGQNGQYGYGMMPFMPTIDTDRFCIDKRNIILSGVPVTDILNKYNSMFGSGIQIAKTF